MTSKEASSFIFITIDKTHLGKFVMIEIASSAVAYYVCKYFTHKEWLAVCSSMTVPYVIKKAKLPFQKKIKS